MAVTGLMTASLYVPVYAEQEKSIFEQAGSPGRLPSERKIITSLTTLKVKRVGICGVF